MLERDIEEYFTKEMERIGAVVRKLRWIGRKGAPDRLIGYCGVIHMVELKQEKGRLSWWQARECKKFKKAGIKISVLSSLEEVDTFVGKLIRRGTL